MSRYEKLSLEELKMEIETIKGGMKKKGFAESLPTPEDIEKRNEIFEKALEVGINLMMTDDTGKENYYRDLALLYIIEGKEVPEELKVKIEEEDRKLKNQKEDYQ